MSTLDATMRIIGFVSDNIKSSCRGVQTSKEEKKDPVHIKYFSTCFPFLLLSLLGKGGGC